MFHAVESSRDGEECAQQLSIGAQVQGRLDKPVLISVQSSSWVVHSPSELHNPIAFLRLVLFLGPGAQQHSQRGPDSELSMPSTHISPKDPLKTCKASYSNATSISQ